MKAVDTGLRSYQLGALLRVIEELNDKPQTDARRADVAWLIPLAADLADTLGGAIDAATMAAPGRAVPAEACRPMYERAAASGGTAAATKAEQTCRAFTALCDDIASKAIGLRDMLSLDGEDLAFSARDVACQIGMLADLGIKLGDGAPVNGGPEDWLLSPSALAALETVRGAA